MFEQLHPRYHVTSSICHDLLVCMIFDNDKQDCSEFLIIANDSFQVGFKNARVISFNFWNQNTIELLTSNEKQRHWLFYKDTRSYVQISEDDATIFKHALTEFRNSENDLDDNNELVYST